MSLSIAWNGDVGVDTYWHRWRRDDCAIWPILHAFGAVTETVEIPSGVFTAHGFTAGNFLTNNPPYYAFSGGLQSSVDQD